MNKKDKISRMLKILGNIIVIIAVVFIVKKLTNVNIDYKEIFTGNNIFIYILLILVYAGAMIICLTTPWQKMVYLVTGRKIAFREVAKVSTCANVMKYIPGNIFQYIGRNSLAVNKGLKHSEVAISTLLDVIVSLVAIFLVTFVFSFRTLFLWMQQYIQVWHIGVILSGILGIIIVFVFFRKKFYAKFQDIWNRIFCKSGIMTIITNMIIYIGLNLVNTAIFIVVLMVLGKETYAIDVICMIAGAAMASWIVGFFTPGAPGGIGVREAILIVLLGGVISESTIILGAIVNRVVSILGDLLAMVVVIVYNKVFNAIPVRNTK